MFESDHVVLRPPRPADVAPQREFFSNPELAALDSHRPDQYARLDVEDLLLGRDSDRAMFAIDRRQPGTPGSYIGYASLSRINDPRGTFELGINIGDANAWGAGLGREAVGLLLRYGFLYLPGRRIELTTHERNERAIRCYAACGFVEEGRLRQALWLEGHWLDLVLMAILRDEWQAA